MHRNSVITEKFFCFSILNIVFGCTCANLANSLWLIHSLIRQFFRKRLISSIRLCWDELVLFVMLSFSHKYLQILIFCYQRRCTKMCFRWVNRAIKRKVCVPFGGINNTKNSKKNAITVIILWDKCKINRNVPPAYVSPLTKLFTGFYNFL